MHRLRGTLAAAVLVIGLVGVATGTAATADTAADNTADTTADNTTATDAGLAWSAYLEGPDGRQTTGWYLQLGSAEPRPVVMDIPDVRDVAFSPDGTKVAFTGTTPKGYRGVWIANATGERPHLLTEGHYDAGPRWSYDGRSLVFQRDFGLPYVMQADPLSTPRPLWDGPNRPGDYAADFDVHLGPSGDGMTFAVFDANGINHPGFYLPYASTDEGMVRLADNVFFPTFSPDGKRIAWAHNSVVTLHTIQTGERSQLPIPEGKIFDLEWSPDGRKLAFSHGEPDGEKAIMTVDIADGTVRTIAEPDADHRGDVTWRADEPGEVNRVRGEDPTATSIAIDEYRRVDIWPPRGAVLVGLDAPEDTAGAAALAGARYAPVYANPRDELDPRVAQALVAAIPDKDQPVYLAGGPRALSPAVADAVRDLGFAEVIRAGSDDELATSLRLAKLTDQAQDQGATRVVLVGVDEDPHVLAAATTSANPVLRVPASGPAPDDPALRFVRQFPDSGGSVIAVGETATDWATAGRVELYGQVDGGDPAAAAVRLAERFHSGYLTDGLVLAPTNETATSGLAPVLAAHRNEPLLFTERNELPAATATYVDERSATFGLAFVTGGDDLVDDAVLTRLGGLIATSVRVAE